MKKFFTAVWKGMHSAISAYIIYAISVAAVVFFHSASWAYGWIAEIYPLGQNFIPVFFAVAAFCIVFNLIYLFSQMMRNKSKKRPVKSNMALDIAETVIAVISIVVFVYTAILLFGLDAGFLSDRIVNGINSVKPYFAIIGAAVLFPVAGLFTETPKRTVKALVASVLVTALVFSTIQFAPNISEKVGEKPMPELYMNSDNVLEGAFVADEMLAQNETPDSENMLLDDDTYWTPQAPNRKPANGYYDVNNSYSEIQLADKSTFNTAVIEEIGNEVQYFRLQAKIGDEWKTIYQSEKIQTMRICSFDAVTTDRIRLSIDKFRSNEAPAKIKSIKLYNEAPRAAENFEVTAYQRLDGDVPTEILKKGDDYVKNYARFYDVYSTVILFRTIVWDENGNMTFGDLTEEQFAAEVNALKQIIAQRSNKEHKVKIIVTALSDGVWEDIGVNGYMAEHWESVADKIVEFVDKYDFDGVDIDWEYPSSPEDWNIYNQFIARIDDGMQAYGRERILTAALSAWGLGMSQDTLDRLDQIQFMAYDGNDKDGYQSSLNQAQEGLLDFVNNGADLSKINIGIAAYGRPINNSPYWATWRDLKQATYWNNKYYNVEDAGQIYDGTFCSPALAGDKTALALLSGAGGVMVFRVACDKTMDDPNSVACGIENALKRYIINW